MTSLRRLVVLAGIAAMGVSGACAKGGDADSTLADSARKDSTVGSARSDSTVAARDTATTKGSTAASAPNPPAAPPANLATGGASGATGVSVTTGVYTAAQAARGSEVYTSSCGQCHTMGQHSGTAFATAWNNRRLFDLYEIVHNTMPLDNPGGLTEQEYIDVIAYMLQLNGVPAGKTSLSADAGRLKALRIDVKPSAGQ